MTTQYATLYNGTESLLYADPVTFNGEPVHMACLRVARAAKRGAAGVYKQRDLSNIKERMNAEDALYYALQAEEAAFIAQTVDDNLRLHYLNLIINQSGLVNWYVNQALEARGLKGDTMNEPPQPDAVPFEPSEDVGDFSDAPYDDPEAEQLRCAGCSVQTEQDELDNLGAKQS